MTETELLVQRAQLVLEATRKKRRKLYRVGQKSRRRSGETFVKTADGWRRVAKNPRKKPGLWGALIQKAKDLLGPEQPQPKPPPSTDTANLFGRPKKRKKTRSARPKPKRSSSTGSPLRWPEPND